MYIYTYIYIYIRYILYIYIYVCNIMKKKFLLGNEDRKSKMAPNTNKYILKKK